MKQINTGKAGFGGNINIMQILLQLLIHHGNNHFTIRMGQFNIIKFLLYLTHMLMHYVEVQYVNNHL